MAINLAPLANLTTGAAALANLVLVSPQSVVGYQPGQPPNFVGPPAQPSPPLLFHYEGEQTVTIESDITDHFVEDNTAIQDQIALKPEIITTHGFIGELNDVTPYGLQTLKLAAEKLTLISAYAPQISVTAVLAYNEAFAIYQTAANVANSAVAAWSSVNNFISDSNGQAVIGSSGLNASSTPQNKQQIAFQQFYGYWRNRVLFTVQTPWAVFENMAIRSLRAIQDAETRVITDFEVSFKMIRTAKTVSDGNAISTKFNGRSIAQASPLNNIGTSSPTPTDPPSTVSGGISDMGVPA